MVKWLSLRQKNCEATPVLVEVAGENLIGSGTFCILNRVKAISRTNMDMSVYIETFTCRFF